MSIVGWLSRAATVASLGVVSMSCGAGGGTVTLEIDEGRTLSYRCGRNYARVEDPSEIAALFRRSARLVGTALSQNHRATAMSLRAALEARDVRRVEQLAVEYMCEYGELGRATDAHGGFRNRVLVAVAVVLTGWFLLVVPARIGDGLIFALAARTGSEAVVNVLRPVLTTVVVFGGGLLAMSALLLQGWWLMAGGSWFFFLTQAACLTGRTGLSLNRAGWAMVLTMAILTIAWHQFG